MRAALRSESSLTCKFPKGQVRSGQVRFITRPKSMSDHECQAEKKTFESSGSLRRPQSEGANLKMSNELESDGAMVANLEFLEPMASHGVASGP